MVWLTKYLYHLNQSLEFVYHYDKGKHLTVSNNILQISNKRL